MGKTTPVVSICCITYNHERYIREAIEGFLLQKVSFPIEIIIHDDCSTDKTPDIIKEYWERYPDVIFPIFQIENQFSKGKRIFNIAAKKAQGEYIAVCEGDDYWTDPFKLQKQVDFLQNNDEFSSVAHQSTVKYESSTKADHFFKTNVQDVLETEDLLSDRLFHTASFLFRRKILEGNDIPDNILAGDRYLFLLCSFSGLIKYLTESMCVYRKNASGISSWVTYDLLKKDLNIPFLLSEINTDFPRFRYLSFVHKTLLVYPEKITFDKFLKHYILYFIFSFSEFPSNLKSVPIFTFFLIKRILYNTVSGVNPKRSNK